MKVAIVECLPYHEEIIPSHVYFLNRLGVIPTVFINDKSRGAKCGLFDLYSSLQFELIPVDLNSPADWSGLTERINDEHFDLVVINTFQATGSLWAISLMPYKLCLVHNVRVIVDHHEILALAARREDIGLVCLGPVGAKALRMVMGYAFGVRKCVECVYAPIFPERFSGKQKSETVHIALVGGINYRNRNYQQVLELAAETTGVIFDVVGGGTDHGRLQRAVTDAGLQERFSFLSPDGGFTSYEAMFATIEAADFLMTAFKKPSRYHEFAISSVINYALGFRKALIQDSITQALYKVPGPIYYRGFEEAIVSNSTDLILDSEHRLADVKSASIGAYRRAIENATS